MRNEDVPTQCRHCSTTNTTTSDDDAIRYDTRCVTLISLCFLGEFYRFYKVVCYTDFAAATGCDRCPAGSLGLCMTYRNSNF